MDTEKAKRTIIEGIQEKCKDRNAIIGLSGGIDSTLVAYLCVEALGKERVSTITMPYGNQDYNDALFVANILGIKCDIIDIKLITNSFLAATCGTKIIDNNKLVNGNMRARVRMVLLYAYANSINGMVIGTGNKTENLLGYSTKFGDGACDYFPIGDLYKTEVWELSRAMKIPPKLVDRIPSAELWEGQTDEGEFGIEYKTLDIILKSLDEEILPIDEIIRLYGEDKVKNVINRFQSSIHKRIMPEIVMIEK
jgi:NAD+ synthase